METDLGIVNSLEDVEAKVLIQPQRQELYHLLWEESWDIVFFAGHSETIKQQGVIYLNHDDVLTIGDLKFALKKAIYQGLQLAIFNSCDGLGLASALSQLSLPQTIVMREYVPDKIAQEFLRYLLALYQSGLSLALAVRQAGERLQGWKKEYPYSSWLPIIYQNPTVMPTTWEDFKQNGCFKKIEPLKKPKISKNVLKKSNNKQKVKLGLTTTAIATCAISLIQSGGWLQFWELKAFDRAISWRVSEARDDRILIVTVDDEDVKYQEENQLIGRGSLGDKALLRFLPKIQPFNPKVIASDIIHDFPFIPELEQTILSQNNFFAICRIKSQTSGMIGINPSNLPLTSNIISAVLDNRPLIWWFPEWGELLWIALWCGLGAGIMVIFNSPKSRVGALTITLLVLGMSFYIFLSFGGWVLVVAPALGILSCYPLYLLTQKIYH